MAGGPAIDLSIGKGIVATLTVYSAGELHPRHPDRTLAEEIGSTAAVCWDPPAGSPEFLEYLRTKAWWAS